MALKTKVDPFGLNITGLECVSTEENVSASTAEATGEDGFVVATEVFGARKAPSAEYIITANTVNLSGIVFGEKSSEHIVKSNLSVTTGAGNAPNVSISGQEVESTTGLTKACKCTLPSITISGLHHAQDFGIFTVAGTGAHLTQSTLTISSNITTAEADGVIKASDLTGGKITVTGTIQVSSPTYAAPTVTLKQVGGKAGVMTSPLSCSNPNGNFPTWTFTAEYPLAADVATS